MVFVVERRTMKFLPTKQFRVIPGCGLVYCDHKNISMNWPKICCSRKFYPPKNTHYTVYMYSDVLLSLTSLPVVYMQVSTALLPISAL